MFITLTGPGGMRVRVNVDRLVRYNANLGEDGGSYLRLMGERPSRVKETPEEIDALIAEEVPL
jgi:hypothetical protein